MTIPIEDQIAEVKREIALRKKVYPKWIEQERITRFEALSRVAVMEAVLESLKSLEPRLL
jgi:hypothetical protein